MYVTNFLFYCLLALLGCGCIISAVLSLCTGQFYGHSLHNGDVWKCRAEIFIVLTGGVYLLSVDIWFLHQ